VSRARRIGIALGAGVFVALVTLGAVGALRDDDRGPDVRRRHEEQWNLALVGVPEAWDVTRGEGAVIAVVDGGVDTRHPDFAGRVEATIDCVGAGGDPDRCGPGGDRDPDGHGTHVAAIALGAADNARAAAGVAPDAGLISVRALVAERCARRPCGSTGSTADVAAGVRWAVGAGADVVNLSVSASETVGDDDLIAAVDEAWDAGVVVVAAGPTRGVGAGLEAAPAITVTAVDADRQPAPYSSGTGGATWALAAPGGERRADTPDGCSGDDAVPAALPAPAGENDASGCLAGTSMAAPHVSGAAALLVALGLDAPAIVERLLDTAVDLGVAGPDGSFGAGLLDVAAAVSA